MWQSIIRTSMLKSGPAKQAVIAMELPPRERAAMACTQGAIARLLDLGTRKGSRLASVHSWPAQSRALVSRDMGGLLPPLPDKTRGGRQKKTREFK